MNSLTAAQREVIGMALVDHFREDGGQVSSRHWPDGHIPLDDLDDHHRNLFHTAESLLDELHPVAQTA
jgi:hypothetical protein